MILGIVFVLRPDRCPCGNPTPAIQVLGRAGDELIFSARNGEQVKVNLIVISIEIDRISGVDLFQLVQTSPTSMRVRLIPSACSGPGARVAGGANPDYQSIRRIPA